MLSKTSLVVSSPLISFYRRQSVRFLSNDLESQIWYQRIFNGDKSVMKSIETKDHGCFGLDNDYKVHMGDVASSSI